MKPKFYPLLEHAVTEGVAYGNVRAYKHIDNPTPDAVQSEIVQAVMNSICEWFDFEGTEDEITS